MEKNKEIKRLLNGAECCIIVTDNGGGVIGDRTEVLSLYSVLTKNLAENFDKELLEKAFNRGFADEKELLTELKNKLDELFKKLGE